VKGYASNTVERRDHAAVVTDGSVLTYGQLDDRARRLAAVLADLGLGPGDRLAAMLPNSPEFFECMAASAHLGVSALNLNWHLKADEVAWILDDSGAGALVTHVSLRDVVDQVVADRHLPVVWVGDDYETRMAEATPAAGPFTWPTSWPVIYTSGTSGRPKGVVHGTQGDPAIMEMTHDMLAGMWGYRPDDIHLAAGPLYHAGPWGYANLTVYTGGTVVVMDGWDARSFLAQVEQHRATTTFLTPAHFIRLLEVPADERRAFDVSSLRHVIHAGAPCPRPVKAAIIEAFPEAEIWELYGMSEGGATRVSSADWLAHPGTVGLPWPGVEIRVLDPGTLEPLATGQDGLIYVKPAQGRFQYHNDPAKTAATWRDDAFSVGDIGHLDDEGWLYLTDRHSDLIIRAGVNVYPREVEEVLYQHPDVVDCAVFGAPDDRDGEHPVAVVELRASDDGAAPPDAAGLDAWCRQRLDPYKVPTRFELVDTLPRDPNGKVLKRLLRDAAWAGTGRKI
jgi:long-chain acyl-CoA synthetase